MASIFLAQVQVCSQSSQVTVKLSLRDSFQQILDIRSRKEVATGLEATGLATVTREGKDKLS